MFIPKELALAMAAGRRKFLSVYEGRAVLFMPFADHARHVSTHYVAELKRSVICQGVGQCQHHHLQEVAKCHVAALVYRKHMPYSAVKDMKLPPVLQFDPAGWVAKIVELTENCFDEFEAVKDYGTLCVISRKPGRKNNPVEFAWLDGHKLENFPAEPLAPENVVPAVIRGTFYPVADVAIDKNAKGRIKHKINSPTESAQPL